MGRAFLRQSDNSEANVRLRAMLPADVANLSDLWVAAWRETLPAIDFEARRAWLAGFLDDPTHTTLVLEGEPGVVGFVTLEGDHLHQLAVAPLAKGRGAAVRLLAAAKAHAPAGLVLDVNQANTRAVRFYEREGFVIVAPGRNPTSGLPTWRMRWCASPPRAPVAGVSPAPMGDAAFRPLDN